MKRKITKRQMEVYDFLKDRPEGTPVRAVAKFLWPSHKFWEGGYRMGRGTGGSRSKVGILYMKAGSMLSRMFDLGLVSRFNSRWFAVELHQENNNGK